MKDTNKILQERGAEWQDTYKIIGDVAGDVLGLKMSQEEFCSFMILLKLVRYRKSGFKNKDCLVDIVGYANLILNDDLKEDVLNWQKDLPPIFDGITKSQLLKSRINNIYFKPNEACYGSVDKDDTFKGVFINSVRELVSKRDLGKNGAFICGLAYSCTKRSIVDWLCDQGFNVDDIPYNMAVLNGFILLFADMFIKDIDTYLNIASENEVCNIAQFIVASKFDENV